MKSYSLQPVPSTVTSTMLSTVTTKPEELYPPVALLQHPPLATFTNSILSAFNGLRHCVPLSLVSAVTESVQSALKAIIQTTCTFHRTEAAALNETERATFANFCQVLGRQLVPYMKRCLEALFLHSALNGLYDKSCLDVSSLQLLLEPMMPQETTQEEEKPRPDDEILRPDNETETTNQENEPGNLVLSKESPPRDESREEVPEDITDTEQEKLDLT
ncbi:hypothetical protein ACROYT_G028601 [Oculina patagonica]